MLEDYTGSPKDSGLVLLVRITVISDGSRRYERLAALMGTGLAKVTISYCLFNRNSGEVAVAKQMSYIGDAPRDSSDGGVSAIWKHAEGIQCKLNQEVKFICCSRVDEWLELAENLVLDSDDGSLEIEQSGRPWDQIKKKSQKILSTRKLLTCA